jgi:hypothetical protein
MTHPTMVFYVQTTKDIYYGLQDKLVQQKHLEILPSIFQVQNVQVYSSHRATHHHHHYHHVLHDE